MFAIGIPWDPNIFEIGGFRFTWHSVFAVVGILAGILVARWLGRRTAIKAEQVNTLALSAVIGGMVTARFLYVIDFWDLFAADPVRIIAIPQAPGITVWGAVIGGAIAVSLAGWWMRLPVRTAVDIGAPGLILGMGIGRIGDLINGEHHALPADLPWAVYYTHPLAVGQGPVNPFAGDWPVHPASTYELLGDLLIFGLALWLARRHTGKGHLFWLVLGGYSAMRFGLQFLRLDQPLHFGVFAQSQIIGLLGMILTGAWLVRRAYRRLAPTVAPAQPERRRRRSSP